MKQDIFKTLQELKRIEPDVAYTKHSRMLVLAAPQHPVSSLSAAPRLSTFLRLSTIVGVGLASIFFILGGISYLNETYSPLALEGLNQKSLVAEANGINSSIEITLGAIDYLDTSNQVTLKKIAEISKTNGTAATLAAPVAIKTSKSSTSTTTMDSFLINSDAAAAPADQKLNNVLDTLSK